MSNVAQYNTFDPNALSALKRASRQQTPESIKEVASQFEALLLQMVMKSMREASKGEGLGDGEGTRFYQGLHDQQMAGVLAQRGGMGLAAVIEKQMLAQAGFSNPSASLMPGQIKDGLLQPGQTPALNGKMPIYDGRFVPGNDAKQRLLPPSNMAGPSFIPHIPRESGAPSRIPEYSAPVLAPQTSAAVKNSNPEAQGFASRIWPQASAAAEKLGVPPKFLVGQAALETGWGKYEMRRSDGSASHNLFNIKAGKGWTGEVIEKRTVEFIDGKAQQRLERFRAYPSYQAAFDDYARLIGQSPRYAASLGKQDAREFAQALQDGGYATDPAYAQKLSRVIEGRTISQSSLAFDVTRRGGV